MMRGVTTGRRAAFPITFRLPEQPNLTLEFVIDTGFTEYLTLPQAAVSAMNLPLLYRAKAGLADGTDVFIAVHATTILWNDIEREVRVLATGRRPLLSTALLDDHELCVQFRESGTVTVEAL